MAELGGGELETKELGEMFSVEKSRLRPQHMSFPSFTFFYNVKSTFFGQNKQN